MTQSDDVHGGGGYADQLRDHKFDGIEEFDNRLPNWWLWTFYLACIFSLFYWLHYHVLGTGALPTELFRDEMAAYQAEAERMQVDESELVALGDDVTAVEEGRAIFESNCAACHGPLANGTMANGTPGIGPNLTDNAWLHGGAPADIYNTIKNGVTEKGMMAWETVLGPERMKHVTAYLLSIRNTDVPRGKAPEGEPYTAANVGN